jgi:hypothetical protein
MADSASGNGAGDSHLSETELFKEEPEAAAIRIIKEAAPFAAASIASMAADETISPSVRLSAAKYVIDRNLGPVGKDGDKESELELFLRELQDEANKDGR